MRLTIKIDTNKGTFDPDRIGTELANILHNLAEKELAETWGHVGIIETTIVDRLGAACGTMRIIGE